MSLQFKDFVRKPFVVEAVEITAENIEEIAKIIGEIEEKEDGTLSIKVDRRLMPNLFRVEIGFYMTRMGDHVRCYNRKVFFRQFATMTPEIKTWVDFMSKTKS
jgi:hypothetical protein